jgi:hypothetical protein
MKYRIFIFSVFCIFTATGYAESQERHFSFCDDVEWDSPIQLAYELESFSTNDHLIIGDYHNDPETAIALVEKKEMEVQKSKIESPTKSEK